MSCRVTNNIGRVGRTGSSLEERLRRHDECGAESSWRYLADGMAVNSVAMDPRTGGTASDETGARKEVSGEEQEGFPVAKRSSFAFAIFVPDPCRSHLPSNHKPT
jgi:hypothetical protein